MTGSPRTPPSAAEFATLMAPLGPFPRGARFAAGVSGGPHSLALALLARDFAASRGGEVVGLVVDHGLRAESAAEAGWTAAALRGQGIAARILALGLARGSAIQERARAGRLAALLEAAEQEGCPWLLLGQHAGDQAETLLFRALRGSGEAGLAGMAAARPAPQAMILRPLLGMAPLRLEALLAARGIAPLRDPSNQDRRFARVRLRQALADPGGEGAGTAALGQAARAFATRRARTEQRIAERIGAAVTLHPEGWASLEAAALGRDALAARALAALLRLISGAEHAPPLAAAAALLERGQGTLHGVLWREGRLCREPAACAPPIPATPGALWDGRWVLPWALPESPPGGEGLLLGAAGAVERRLRQGLPADVAAGLPALWRGTQRLAIPALGGAQGAGEGPWEGVRLVFCPAGGPLCPA
ncbi:tRNA lysidine(34) synthetase TilS [Roseomonas sp. GC11]|uniref:tRNA lysidine(34) synthetase TilS n=1 Tax=Roseomonas sp. GC11 TaxID=2950546 RepID=UPI00210A7AF9|nr:tRNA lysidine(34) synthetase TilS [Roseomonas sp. GC11]